MKSKFRNLDVEKIELSKRELKNSFKIFSPITGSLGPLDFSRDVILRTTKMGLGFVLDSFTGKKLRAPIDGKITFIFKDASGVIIKNEQTDIYVIVKFSEELEFLYGRGFKLFCRVGDNVKVGAKLIEVDREIFEDNQLRFQVTVCFYRKDNVKARNVYRNTKYDILYGFKTRKDNVIEVKDFVGTIYRAERSWDVVGD